MSSQADLGADLGGIASMKTMPIKRNITRSMASKLKSKKRIDKTMQRNLKPLILELQ